MSVCRPVEIDAQPPTCAGVGASKADSNQARTAGESEGRRNGEAARELLAEHGIEVLSENLFGNGHRQIVFDVGTGDVWVRHHSGTESTRPQELS